MFKDLYPKENIDKFLIKHAETSRKAIDLLSISRGVSGSYFAYKILQTDPSERSWPLFTAVSAFCATDWIDGKIARTIGTTVEGGRKDELADKAFSAPIMLALGIKGEIPIEHFYLKVGRDLGVTALRTMAQNQGVDVKAKSLGKYKTVCEMIGIGLSCSPIAGTKEGNQAINLSFATALGLSAASSGEYFMSLTKAVGDTPVEGLVNLIKPYVEDLSI